MTFVFRTVLVLIAAAFLFAVANLYVSGVPQRSDDPVELASADPNPQPILPQSAPSEAEAEGYPFISTLLHLLLPDQFDEPQVIADLRDPAIATPITAPVGFRTPPTIAPASAGGPRPETGRAPAPVTGPDVDAITAAWTNWMQANAIETGALALIFSDGTEYGTGLGNRTVEDIRPVMSMSKTITGLCVDQLLLENGLGWDTTLADIAAQMSAAGLTPRPWNDHITLASLATHTSGLAPDLTQSNMVQDNHGALGLHRRWSSAALQEDAITGDPGVYFYSNTNYTVLGVVVEALSGQSYAQACMDRILTPAGITDAVIEGRYGSLSSYAGWEISAMDYARLTRHWFAEDQPHMTDARPDFDGYAIGYFDDGQTIRHTGRFCQRDHPTGGVGSLFIHHRNGSTLSINWDACIHEDRRAELIQQLLELL